MDASPDPVQAVRIRCGGQLSSEWIRRLLCLFRHRGVNIQKFWLCEGYSGNANAMDQLEMQFALHPDHPYKPVFLDEVELLLQESGLKEHVLEVAKT
jgi:hypothetical protein